MKGMYVYMYIKVCQSRGQVQFRDTISCTKKKEQHTLLHFVHFFILTASSFFSVRSTTALGNTKNNMEPQAHSDSYRKCTNHVYTSVFGTCFGHRWRQHRHRMDIGNILLSRGTINKCDVGSSI